MTMFQKLESKYTANPEEVRPVQYDEMRQFTDTLILFLIRKLHKLRGMEVGMYSLYWLEFTYIMYIYYVHIYNAYIYCTYIYLFIANGNDTRCKLADSPMSTFDANLYKFITVLGFLGMRDVILQSVIGDKGGIQVIIDYMVYYKVLALYLKWCSWALIVSK